MVSKDIIVHPYRPPNIFFFVLGGSLVIRDKRSKGTRGVKFDMMKSALTGLKMRTPWSTFQLCLFLAV